VNPQFGLLEETQAYRDVVRREAVSVWAQGRIFRRTSLGTKLAFRTPGFAHRAAAGSVAQLFVGHVGALRIAPSIKGNFHVTLAPSRI